MWVARLEIRLTTYGYTCTRGKKAPVLYGIRNEEKTQLEGTRSKETTNLLTVGNEQIQQTGRQSPRQDKQPTVHGSLTASGRISWLILLYRKPTLGKRPIFSILMFQTAVVWHHLEETIAWDRAALGTWNQEIIIPQGSGGRSVMCVGRRQEFRRGQDEPRSLRSRKVVKERKVVRNGDASGYWEPSAQPVNRSSYRAASRSE